MRKTKIVVTLGPSVESEEVLEEIFKIADIARFNFSHGSHDYHKNFLDKIRRVEKKLNKVITTIADLKGPEIRTTNKEAIEVKKGDVLSLSDDIGLNAPDVINVIKQGDEVLIDDGNIKAIVEEGDKIKFLNEGIITNKRKVTFPGKNVPLPALSEKDIEDIKFIVKEGWDIIDQTFVREVKDVERLRELSNGIKIIAKIEHPKGVENLEEIGEKVDGFMVARGDLGVEVPVEEVPVIQKNIIRLARRMAKPVIVATHMLKSMVDNPHPTRAEVSDVASAVFDGADAVMLSEETSKGNFPVEAVKVMDKIARRIEKEQRYEIKSDGSEYKDLISKSALELSNKLEVPVVAPTVHGTTPRKLSSLRPGKEILSPCEKRETVKYLNLFYAVKPLHYNYEPVFDKIDEIKKLFGIEKAIFVFGYPPGNKRTNTIMYM